MAFAVAEKGGAVIIETVSPTARAARVNWLCVRADIMVTNGWTDGQIAEAFERLAPHAGVELVPVQVLRENALPRSATMMIVALLEKLGGAAFVHDTELADLDLAWRLRVERELFPQEGVKLSVDKGAPRPADTFRTTLQLGAKP